MISQRRFAGAIGLALLLIWIVLAIRPVSRSDWLLENTLVILAVPLIGAHYTYSEVPFLASDTGRNHYDRLAHFLYGLLMARPTIDLLAARAPPRGIWLWLLPVLFLASHGPIYEVLEWLAAERFGGNLGAAFLGTQGDVWDAQKDMGLAMLGAVIGVTAWRVLPAKS